MPDGVERAIGSQNDSELFRLAVAEITHAPKCSRNALRVDGVDSRNTDSLTKEFIYSRIGDVRENGSVVIRIWINAALSHDLVRARASRSRIDGQFQVFADGLRLQPPCQHTSGEQTDG